MLTFFIFTCLNVKNIFPQCIYSQSVKFRWCTPDSGPMCSHTRRIYRKTGTYSGRWMPWPSSQRSSSLFPSSWHPPGLFDICGAIQTQTQAYVLVQWKAKSLNKFLDCRKQCTLACRKLIKFYFIFFRLIQLQPFSTDVKFRLNIHSCWTDVQKNVFLLTLVIININSCSSTVHTF